MFSQDNYRALSKYLKERAADLEKDEKEKNGGGGVGALLANISSIIPGAAREEMTDAQKLVAAARQLDAVRCEPMVVEALLEEYEVPLQVLEVPLEELPLYINDDGILTQTIAKWRFDQGV